MDSNGSMDFCLRERGARIGTGYVRELVERGAGTVVTDVDPVEQGRAGAPGSDAADVGLERLDGLLHPVACLFQHGVHSFLQCAWLQPRRSCIRTSVPRRTGGRGKDTCLRGYLR